MNKKRYIKIFLFLLIISSLLIGGYFFIHKQINTPASNQPQEQNFIIKKGESLKEISSHLEEQGLINQDYWFKFYVLTKGWAARLQAGEYILSPSMTISEIAESMVMGKTVLDIQVTVPEGFTTKQIDARLTKIGLIEKDELINFDIDKIQDTKYKIQDISFEGFLFPDTYKFRKGSSVEDIVIKMLDNFDRKIDEDLRVEIQKQNKTIFEIIILASIIQNEALTDKEMPILAGIFYNRLDIGLALQSDVTINYITGKNLRQPTLRDISIDSPYNTYLHKGLPPGPISNPGLSAIKAAIYPEKTDYLYFLHPLNSSAVFSRTFEEHKMNKAKYLPR